MRNLKTSRFKPPPAAQSASHRYLSAIPPVDCIDEYRGVIRRLIDGAFNFNSDDGVREESLARLEACATQWERELRHIKRFLEGKIKRLCHACHLRGKTPIELRQEVEKLYRWVPPVRALIRILRTAPIIPVSVYCVPHHN